MQNSTLLSLFIFCFFCSTLSAQSDFKVQLTALVGSVPVEYIGEVENLEIVRASNGIIRLYQGEYATATEAEEAAKSAREKGFKYARVIDMKEIKEECSGACSPQLYVENIFFDFDRSDLRPQSRVDLSNLAVVLKNNPSYSALLTAHTDAKGSNSYNINLSKRRAESARQFLLSNGIPSNRLKTAYKGEVQPIAKNDLGGEDSPAGRQFNRRVEVTLLDGDGRVVPNVVRGINVPGALRN